MNKSRILLATTGLSCILLLQGTAVAAPVWSNAVTITNIEVDPVSSTGYGSSTYLTFNVTPSGKPPCSSAQSIFVGNGDQIKAMTSLAMAAFLAGRSVKVYWADNTCDGGSVYPHISLIQVF